MIRSVLVLLSDISCIYHLELRDLSFNEFVHGILHAVCFNCNGFLNIRFWMEDIRSFGEGLFGLDDRI